MKTLIIISLACMLTFNLTGCGTTALEQGPTVIQDSLEDNIDISEPQEEQEGQKDDDNQDPNTSTEPDSQEDSEDSPVTDSDESDSKDKDNTETFKGIIMLEGMEEEVNYRTYHSDYGYQMNYDVDRFTVTSDNGIDTFMAENINPEIYPYIFISITRSEYLDGEKVDSHAGQLHVYDEETDKILQTNYPKDNVKIGDYDAIHFEVIDGSQWNSLVKHIYIIDFEENYYVIETNYFLEASEGYGVRIKAMLDTIVIED